MADFKLAGAPSPTDYNLDQTKAIGRKPTLNQAGKAFEGLFLQTIMKSMREAKLGDGDTDTLPDGSVADDTDATGGGGV